MSMVMRHRIDEVSVLCGTSNEVILHYVEEEWLIPYDRKGMSFDDEDIARLRLILELQREFGVNEEAIPIILRLIDQLHLYRRALDRPS